MSNGAADYYKEATEHHESAAHHAPLAHGHDIHATHHVSQSAPSSEAASVEVRAMNIDRGAVNCVRCKRRFIKTQVTSRGQCLLCARAHQSPGLGF
jgi:hypothetical protein